MDPELDPNATEDQNQDDLDTSGEGDGGEQVEEGVDADTEGGATDEGETVITLGGEPEQVEEEDDARAPTWVRDVRKTNRELVRKTREQEAEIARLKGGGASAAPAAIVVGPEPTFEDCEYDPDKFKAATLAWSKRKQEADAQETARAETRGKEEKQWRGRLEAVDAAGEKLKVRDPEGAMLSFENTFSVMQRGIILGAPDDPKTSAALRLALGSNPKLAKDLAAITDPIKFALKLADHIRDMKMTTRKPAPVPERRISGNVAGAAAVDNTLERLRKEAEKTGDLSKVVAYKNNLKAKARAA